ncbi:MAG: outer membrane beta-barrel protein [Candidatus Aminicenantes bacterium]
MKKMTVLAVGLLLLVPSLAFSDTISLRFGYFMPGAKTDILTNPDSLWAIEFDQMSFKMSDYRGSIIGLGYEYFVTPQVSLALTVDTYSKSRPGYYLDYVKFSFEEGDFAFPFEYYDGANITHAFGVSITPVQASVKIAPLGRKTRVIPYVGGGAGFTFWSVKLYGEMVNFADDTWVYDDPELGEVQIYPIEFTNGRERRTQFSYHGFAGIEFPIGYRLTLMAEARYHYAKSAFKEWFLGFEDFDLGGLALTVGFNYWF